MKLVGMALTKWAPHVPDRAFRVLLRMAATALDEDSDKMPAALYFGGRDLLIGVLRAERNGSLKSAERAVGKAINELIQMGAIERTNRAYFGVRSVYKLTLFASIKDVPKPVDNSREGGSHGYPMVDSHGYPLGDSHGSKSPAPTGTPRSTEEVLEEQSKEESVDLSAPVTVPGTTTEPQNDKLNSTVCSNPECIVGYVIDKTKPKGKRNSPCPECSPPTNVIQFGRRRA